MTTNNKNSLRLRRSRKITTRFYRKSSSSSLFNGKASKVSNSIRILRIVNLYNRQRLIWKIRRIWVKIKSRTRREVSLRNYRN